MQERTALKLAPLALALATALPGIAHAQSGVKGGEETLLLHIGAVSSTIETNARIDGSTTGGSNIDLEGETGLNGDKTTFSLAGYLRFANRHRLDGAYEQVKRSASKNTERQFVIGDNVIPAGTRLSAEQETKLGYAGYRYSFYKNPDMEVAAGLGIYGGNFKFKFDAQQPVVNVDSSTTLPLPVFVLTGDFYLTPQLTLTAALRGLKVKIGDVDGSVGNASLTGEYYFTKNLGVGATLDYLDIKADVTKSGFRGELELKSSSARIFLTARF